MASVHWCTVPRIFLGGGSAPLSSSKVLRALLRLNLFGVSVMGHTIDVQSSLDPQSTLAICNGKWGARLVDCKIPISEEKYVLPARLQIGVDFWQGNLAGHWREFCGIFQTHQIKASKTLVQYQSISSTNIRNSTKTKFAPTSFCRHATPKICDAVYSGSVKAAYGTFVRRNQRNFWSWFLGDRF